MIFVTGGAGFIGSNFVLDWLAQSDEPVLNYDKLTYAGNLNNLATLKQDPRHTFVRGDICDQAQVLALFQQHKPRAVVHFAAESHVDRSILGPGEFINTNINGTFSLLEAALGLEFDAARGEIRLRNPRLPAFLNEVMLRDLQLGPSSVDLRVRRYGDDVSLEVLRTRGRIQVSIVLAH